MKINRPRLSVSRQLSAEAINVVINHPDVFPYVSLPGSGPIDLSSIVADAHNYVLMGEGGGVVLIPLGGGVYEAHTQFVPESRGTNCLRAARDIAFWMFTRTDCIEIRSKVPEGNGPARALAKSLRGRFVYHVKNIWPTHNGMVGADHYVQTFEEWMMCAPYLEGIGHEFHEALEAAKIISGSKLAIHEDDECHDRAVGAACEMIAAGNIGKAMHLYNLWARTSGYAQISIIAQNPITIDIQDALITADGDEMEVILCR